MNAGLLVSEQNKMQTKFANKVPSRFAFLNMWILCESKYMLWSWHNPVKMLLFNLLIYMCMFITKLIRLMQPLHVLIFLPPKNFTPSFFRNKTFRNKIDDLVGYGQCMSENSKFLNLWKSHFLENSLSLNCTTGN